MNRPPGRTPNKRHEEYKRLQQGRLDHEREINEAYLEAREKVLSAEEIAREGAVSPLRRRTQENVDRLGEYSAEPSRRYIEGDSKSEISADYGVKLHGRKNSSTGANRKELHKSMNPITQTGYFARVVKREGRFDPKSLYRRKPSEEKR
jgi:hypothetical protein